MDYRINHINKTIRPTASKAVGKYGRGLLVGRQARAPDRQYLYSSGDMSIVIFINSEIPGCISIDSVYS